MTESVMVTINFYHGRSFETKNRSIRIENVSQHIVIPSSFIIFFNMGNNMASHANRSVCGCTTMVLDSEEHHNPTTEFGIKRSTSKKSMPTTVSLITTSLSVDSFESFSVDDSERMKRRTLAGRGKHRYDNQHETNLSQYHRRYNGRINNAHPQFHLSWSKHQEVFICETRNDSGECYTSKGDFEMRE
jgi:hypothetical protein